MNTFKCLAASACFLFLSGCAFMFDGYSSQKLSEVSLQPYQKLIHVLVTTPAIGTDNIQLPPLVEQKCFNTFTNPKDVNLQICTQQRNSALSALIIGSAESCVEHRKSIYGREAAWNIGLGTATSLFSGAAAVVSGSQGKSILGALALFSNSERSLLNESVYKQMLVTSVDKKIVEMRDTKMQAIYASMKLDMTKYSFHEALRDVVDLHGTCSFMDGLQKALDEGTQATAAQKITRLKSNLRSLRVERDGIPDSEAAAGQKQAKYAAGLDLRITEVSQELAIEEKK